MKNLHTVICFLICWFFIFPNESIAQIRTIHEGDNVTIGDNAIMTISGDLKDSSQTANQSIENLGQLYLNGNMINEGVNHIFGYDSSLVRFGIVNFFGTTSHTIQGTGQINFCNLHINLPSNNLIINKKIQVNDSLYFIDGNVFLSNDTLVLYYLNSLTTDTLNGIIGETNANRIFGPNYPIVVQNYPWNDPGTYSFTHLKGIGIDFKSNDYLGATKPNIYRFNLAQQCGPLVGSVDRTYRFDNITTPGKLRNVTGRFHDPSERSMFADGDSMHVYFSDDDLDSWRDIEGTSGTGIVTNANDPALALVSNFAAYTITKDSCDSLPDVFIHQILNVSDTIFNVDSALFCDPSNPTSRLIADGSIGDYIWITPLNDTIAAVQLAEYQATQLGTYGLVCTNSRGCDNRKNFDLVAADSAESAFTVPLQTCDQIAVSFSPDVTVSTSSYFWEFGDGDSTTTTPSPSADTSHLYSTYGDYTVSLTVTTNAGCISQESATIIVNPIPIAAFSPGTACHNSSVTFTNQTTISLNNATTLYWDFTNNNSVDDSTSQFDVSGGDAQFTYPAAGTYNVTLTATSMGCSSIPVMHPVTVNPLPSPSFTTLSACQGQAVNFINTTDTVGFSPTTFVWSFDTSLGLGSPTSTFENPSNTYATANTYTVSLEATNVFGCTDTIVTAVTVDENPVSAFSLTDTCENSQAIFTDLSTAGSSTISGWNWNFGDGDTAITPNASHIYLANGIYTATLTVSTPQNCTSTSTQSITIFDGPSVGFSVLPTCENVPVNIWNTSTNAVSYDWTISTFTNSQNVNVVHNFSTSGYHEIILEATSINGCKNTVTDSVLVNSLPIDNFGDTTRTCGNSLTLDANNNSSNPTASFSWNTGDNTSDINVTVVGLYTVNITTTAGCSLMDTTYALLNVPVSPSLGVDGAQCDSAELDAGYYGSGSSYSWSSSVPSISATSQEISIFADGQYIVHVTDQNGCIGSDTVNITIVPSTPVDLGSPLQDTCEGIVYTLVSDITGSYLWSDGSTSATLDVVTPGYYWIEVTAGGCSSRDTVEVVFNAIPTFSLGSAVQECDSVVLNAYSGTGVSYEWSTQNGNTQFSDTVYTTGTYWADVTLTSTGCVIRDSIDVTIYSSPVINLPGDTSICSYQTLTIDPGNPGGVNFLWNTGATTPTIDVASTGNYSVTLVDATTGCLSTNSMNVISLPLFTFDLGNDVPYCEGSTVIIEADVTVINATYSWYNNTSTLASTETYTVLDTGLYYLEIIDEHGCSAIDSIDVLPSNLVLYSVFLVDSDIESCDSVQFVNLSYPKPYTSSWNFGDGSALVSDSMPLKRYCLPPGVDSVTYEVTLTVNNGTCNSVETKSITVKTADKALENEPYNPDLYTSILEAIVFPNPNNGDFTLRLKLENTAAIQVDVFNLMGQLIETDSFTAKEIDKSYTLNKILPGMYLVRIRAGRDEKTVKFIKIYR